MNFCCLIGFAAELCLYFSFAGYLFAGFGSGLPQPAVFAALLVLEIGCWLLRKKPVVLRMLPLVIFIFLFLTDISIASLLFLIPPALLTGIRCVRQGWSAERDTVSRLLTISPFAYLIFAGLYAMSGHYTDLMVQSLPWFIFWLLLAVFQLRLSRTEGQLSKRLVLLNAALLTAGTAAAFLLSRPAVISTVLSGLRLLYSYVLGPLLTVVLLLICAVPFAVIYGIVWLIRSAAAGSTQEVQITMGESAAELFGEVEESVGITPAWLHTGMIVLGIVLFALVTFLIVRKLAGSGKKAIPAASGLVRETVQPDTRGRPRIHNTDRLAAGSIRASYRRYLKLCRGCGIETDGTIASDQISEESGRFMDSTKAEYLRQLWLPARFSSKPETDFEAKQAAKLVNELIHEAKRHS